MSQPLYKPQSFTDDRVARGYCYDVPTTDLGGIVEHRCGIRFEVGPTLLTDTDRRINFLREVPEVAPC